jgi:hypothetical protein
MQPLLDEDQARQAPDPDWVNIKDCLRWWESRRGWYTLLVLPTILGVLGYHHGMDILHWPPPQALWYWIFRENLFYTFGWIIEVGFFALIRRGMELPWVFPRRLVWWAGLLASTVAILFA